MGNVNEKSNKVVIDLGNLETEDWVSSNTLELEFYLTEDENVNHISLDFLKDNDIILDEVIGDRKLAYNIDCIVKIIEEK